MLVLTDVPSNDQVANSPQIVWEHKLQSTAARYLDNQVLFAFGTFGKPMLDSVIEVRQLSPLEWGPAEDQLFSEPDFLVDGSFRAGTSKAVLPDLDFEF